MALAAEPSKARWIARRTRASRQLRVEWSGALGGRACQWRRGGCSYPSARHGCVGSRQGKKARRRAKPYPIGYLAASLVVGGEHLQLDRADCLLSDGSEEA